MGLRMATSFFSTLSIDCISYARQCPSLRINRMPNRKQKIVLLICFFMRPGSFVLS